MHDAPTTSPFRQPRAVWAVAFACVVSFMGIGLVDPILKSLAGQLHATPDPGGAALHQLPRDHRRRDARHRMGVEPPGREANPDRRPRDHRRVRGTRGIERLDRRHRRLPRRLGPRQRALHRHVALRHRGERLRQLRRRDHPLRDRARRRHRARPGDRRPARQRQLARPVLRRQRADGDRARRDAHPAAEDARPRPQAAARRAPRGPEAPLPRDHERRRPALQLGLLHTPRLLAVPHGHRQPDPARPRVLRMGRARRDLLRVRRPAPAAHRSAPRARST